MNNKDNYKKAIDQIHPSEELKRKTFEKCMNESKNKTRQPILKYLAVCAMFVVVFLVGQNYIKVENNTPTENTLEIKQVAKLKNSELPRFESMDELKKAIKRTSYREYATNGFDIIQEADVAMKSETLTDSVSSEQSASVSKNYSTTNTQVENVDEADVVKTDGEYIYYIKDNKILIIKANSLEIISEINNNEELYNNQVFSPTEIFINGKTLVAIGNEFCYEKIKNRTNSTIINTEIAEDFIAYDSIRVKSNRTAKAIVYDITDPKNPSVKREVVLDGYYSNSRMIGENVYFISTKNAYYSEELNDSDILPIYKDTAVSQEIKQINYSDIAYFKGTESYNFTLIAGFNINNTEEIFIETFLGASDTVYVSENNIYLSQVQYKTYFADKSIIYKFNLEDGAILFQAKGEVKGDLNNQFAMDEYEGNLRIATTDYSGSETVNQVYILDENLKEIGKIENMAPDEKIYSVRFVGKIGYVVTFKQIDPLFVIDLSDPTNPTIKGKLKIPGYSSYLHPYDETHIIGIGYNTETNKYGNTTNTSMKMSMFDVSDLENPKEIFNVSIERDYSYSEILSNHKALFYDKTRNLIGFPVSINDYYLGKHTNNFILFKIDLEKGFEEYGRISQKIDYRTNIDRAIYIKDILYVLSEKQVVSYDINTMEKLNVLLFEEKENNETIEEIVY